ncbi:hypothetical protein AAG570_009200 [Ranatra chinensis]|uniref:Uncharacterized protein n=1 Tax=Ranatra chinensis TaxID=642074 RepID=A0ABD0YT44_9HEMI
MASKGRKMFYQNKKRETTAIGHTITKEWQIARTVFRRILRLVLLEHISALGRHPMPERLWVIRVVLCLYRDRVFGLRDGTYKSSCTVITRSHSSRRSKRHPFAIVLVGLCLLLTLAFESGGAAVRSGGFRRRAPTPGVPMLRAVPYQRRAPANSRVYRQQPHLATPPQHHPHHKWAATGPYRAGPPRPPKYKRGTTHLPPARPVQKFRYYGHPGKTGNPPKYAHLKPSVVRTRPERRPNPYLPSRTEVRPSVPPYAALPDSYPEPHSTHYGKPHPTQGSPEPPLSHKNVGEPRPTEKLPTSYVSFYKTDTRQTPNDLYDASGSSKDGAKVSATSYGYKQTHHYASEDSDESSREGYSRGTYGYKTADEGRKKEVEESDRSRFQAPERTFGFVPVDDPAPNSSRVQSSASFSLVPSKSYYVGTTIEHSPQTSPVLSPNYYDEPSSSATVKT